MRNNVQFNIGIVRRVCKKVQRNGYLLFITLCYKKIINRIYVGVTKYCKAIFFILKLGIYLQMLSICIARSTHCDNPGSLSAIQT